jgi:hypothetical protein
VDIMANFGNSGHRGYKMSVITSIAPQDGKVAVSLECGHVQLWEPYHDTTAEEWAAHIQQGYRPIIINKTRLRCKEEHQ